MFLIRSVPLKNEHLLSYLLRLSIANGFKNTIQLLRCIDIPLTNNRLPPKKVALGNFPIDLLRKEINLKTNQLSATLFHQVDDNFYRFNQLIIPTSSINFSKPTFCPHCFCVDLNQPFHHLLLPVTHCHMHHCALVDFNPRNEKRLTWSTANLQQIMEEVSSTATEKNIPTVTSNINKLLSTTSERLIVGKQQFNLKNYLVLLHFFAHYHQRSFSNQTKRALQLSNEQRAELYNTANDCLNDWPKGFYTLLNRFIVKPMAQKGKAGIRYYFRDLYDELYMGSQQKVFAYQFLINTFEDYLENEFVESAFTDTLTRIETPLHHSATCLSESSVAKLIDTPVSHLKLFVNAELLTLQNNGTFLKKDIDEFIVKSKGFIALKTVTKLLGIGKYQILKLVESNLLKCVIRPDSKFRDWLFDIKELQALISKIKGHATSISALPVTLKPTTFKVLTFNGICISTVIKNILSEKTAVTYIEEPINFLSLQQFSPCFDYTSQPDSYFSPKQASKLIEVNINAIYDFIKRGILKGEEKQVGRTSRKVILIHKNSINYFKDHYILTKYINKNEKQDYQLVSGRKKDGGLVNLYIKKSIVN